MPDWDCVNGMASDVFDYDYEVRGPQAAMGVGLGADSGGPVTSATNQPQRNTGIVCASCGDNMRTRNGKYGLFWYCPSGKGCKTVKA